MERSLVCGSTVLFKPVEKTVNSSLKLSWRRRREPYWVRCHKISIGTEGGTRAAIMLVTSSEPGTKTKCLKIRHFSRFPQVDSYPPKVTSSQSVLAHFVIFLCLS